MATVRCARGISLTESEVGRSDLLRNWQKQFDRGWILKQVWISDGVKSTDGVVRMLFAAITLSDREGFDHQRIVFLRGGTTDVLTILVTPDGREHVAYVEEKRVAIGRTFLTNAAGMIDGNELPVMAAIRERGEEVGGDSITWSTPISLNRKILGDDIPMYVSPGGTDETVFFYVTKANVTWAQMRALDGSIGGLKEEDELTTVRITPIKHAISALRASGVADMKAIASLTWYQLPE
ncbi:MAG TPA: hypothetical protein VJ841_04505 [Candidatus Saccharimonadales bacterium]|nr:hypothetical protein [Candidatus Saccharimonadales bacterium]